MCSDLCHNSCLLSDLAEPSRSGLKNQQKFAVCHIRRENIRSTAKRNLAYATSGEREREGERERGRGREREREE